jgi:hypothetical protein
MNKNTVLGVGALLIILATVVLYAATKPLPAKAPGESASGVALPASGYVEHADYYDIATNYASSTPLQGEKNTAAVALMQKFVSDTIEQFKTDGNFANLTAEDIKTMGFDQGRKETLQIAYLIASSPRTVSYIFTVYEDTLGAHGITFFHTFTFDTTTGTLLTLDDLFIPSVPGTSTLFVLSNLARTKLPGIIGDGADMKFIQDGTTLDEKNFQNFFFDNKDFVILFDPYAVAPYSSGPQTLRIPLSELTSILKPEYQK